ncbi:iron ABC transporter [Sediminicola luteus]|uniref:Iron ABC transporter n=2 Tax=Sediminicola luteus TaxID=319238 RepID=A0A2A4G3C7_9FLAO|nr:iron ABC transporter [Sediminicola luteus]
MGSVYIPLRTTFDALLTGTSDSGNWGYIIWQFRIPKAISAIIIGSGLSLSGLLMQTLFRNPLAGPYVLGVSSGASLGAAILIMGAGLVPFAIAIDNPVTLVVASALGSFLVLMAVMGMARKTKDSMALLIIGLMFGSITSAVVSVLSYFSEAEALQRFIIWSLGSLGHLSWGQIGILALALLLGLLFTVISIKSLNGLLLGETYAQSMGTDIKKARIYIILAAGILAGSITAFAGPIAFVGLAVPHLARQLFDTTQHKVMVPATLLLGAILMLLCDIVAQLPGYEQVLPINAITSIIGAPIVIWLLWKRNKMLF